MNWTIKLRSVTEDLRRKAKAAASLKGQTLERFIVAAIRAAIAKEK